MYELVEGPYLTGTQHLSRLYYTLPLALVYAAMTALIQSLRIKCTRHLLLTGILLFAATLLNIRIGGLGFCIMILFLFTNRTPPFIPRAKILIRLAIPLASAFGVFAVLTITNPDYMKNTSVYVREVMWLSAFLSVAALHLVLLRRPLLKGIAGLSPLGQRCAFALIGYLSVYTVLFILHQVYYGNLLRAGDFSDAVTVSDWALMGVLAGLKKPTISERVEGDNPYPWLIMWLLTFVAIAISGFGQGWFLTLTPQRLLVFVGVPLSACSAYALHTCADTNRRVAMAYGAAMITLGITSIIVGALFFQLPLGNKPGQGPFALLHPETMTRADASQLETLPEGRILSNFEFSDVIAKRPGTQVLGGTGGTDLSDQMSIKLTPHINQFFSRETGNKYRVDFLNEWCIDYVYCPDTWPIDETIRLQLRSMEGVSVLNANGAGVVFDVRLIESRHE